MRILATSQNLMPHSRTMTTRCRMPSSAARRWLLLGAIAAACASANTVHVRISPAHKDPSTTAPAAAANPICTLSIERLVFTLADLSKRDCGATASGGDSRCSSLCWCRQWASAPVTSATLAQCVAVADTASCVGQDQIDCRAVLGTTAPPTGSSNTTNDGRAIAPTAEKAREGTSPWVYVLVTAFFAGMIGSAVFAYNWYRNRPRPKDTPATVMLSEPTRQGSADAWTEEDTYTEKLPATLPIIVPTRRGSIHSDQAGTVSFHTDRNASMISGVSGTSYHDLDGTQLGHLNEAHALTDTELSLSRDAARPHVFSPLSANGSVALTDSQLSVDSVDVRFQPDHRSGSQRAFSPLGDSSGPQSHHDSSFISVASTTYLTNNDTFSSQLTVTESESGSTTSHASSMFRETEF